MCPSWIILRGKPETARIASDVTCLVAPDSRSGDVLLLGGRSLKPLMLVTVREGQFVENPEITERTMMGPRPSDLETGELPRGVPIFKIVIALSSWHLSSASYT